MSIQIDNNQGNDEQDSFADSDCLKSVIFGNSGCILDIPIESQEPVYLCDDDPHVEREYNVVQTEVDDGTK